MQLSFVIHQVAELEKQDNGQTQQSKQEIFCSTVHKFMMVLGLTENRECGFSSHCCCLKTILFLLSPQSSCVCWVAAPTLDTFSCYMLLSRGSRHHTNNER